MTRAGRRASWGALVRVVGAAGSVRAIAVVFGLLLGVGRVEAQLMAAGEGVRLEVEDCEGVSGASVRELVVLEVAPRPVLALGSIEPAATRAELTCEAGVARIVVEEQGRSRALSLELELSDLAESARARGLALAVAELIATSRLQRQQPTASAQAPPEAHEQPSYEPPLPSEPARFGAQLWLGAGIARAAQPSMLGPSGALGVVAYWDALAISAGLRFEHATASHRSAELQLTAGSLALAPAWRVHASSAELLIGAGARAGFATLSAHSNDPTFKGESLSGFWLAPCAQAAVHVRLARRWSLRIDAEAAYVTRALRGFGADGQTLLELRGLSLAAQLGISWDVSASN